MQGVTSTLKHSQMFKVVYEAGIGINSTYGKQNDDFMTEKLNITRPSLKVIIHQPLHADHIKITSHNINWDHFDILASIKMDFHHKIKEIFLIQEQPSLTSAVSREKLMLYIWL